MTDMIDTDMIDQTLRNIYRLFNLRNLFKSW